MDRGLLIYFCVPILFMVVFFFLSEMIEFSSPLRDGEKEVFSFSAEEITYKLEKRTTPIIAKLNNPFRVTRIAKKEVKKEEEKKVVLKKMDVSIIILTEEMKMAIINGMVVEEGDMIDDTEVAKIEKKRVFLKGKGERWIYLEGK